MNERELFDADEQFRREIDREKVRQRQQARQRGIDQQIAEAMERGDFDALPGKGKPLRWDSDRDDEAWMANHVLKNAGMVPGWIEDAKRIQAEREDLKRELERIERWLGEARAELEGSDEAEADGAWVAGQLRQRVDRWRERAEALNRLIDRFNLEVPLRERQVMRLRIDAELARFVEDGG